MLNLHVKARACYVANLAADMQLDLSQLVKYSQLVKTFLGVLKLERINVQSSY